MNDLNRILTIFIINTIGFTLSASSQYVPMLRANCEWYTYSWFEISYNTTFKISGDSIVNDTTYKKLISFPTGNSGGYNQIDLVREDTNSRTVYRRANDRDYLLYNYNLQVGDTFLVKNPEWGNAQYQVLLDSITDTLYNSTGNYLESDVKNKKVYYFHDIYWSTNDNIVWMEGIGSLAGIIFSIHSWSGGNLGETLLCHYDESSNRDFHYIYNEEQAPCEGLVTGISKIENQNDVLIYPNPSFSGIYKVEGSNIKVIEIENALGGLISFSYNASKNIQIDIGKYPKGIYFMKILFNDNKICFRKLINN